MCKKHRLFFIYFLMIFSWGSLFSSAREKRSSSEVSSSSCGGISKRTRVKRIPKCSKCIANGEVRPWCVECGGSRVCEHKRRKSGCIECGGSRICEHKRIRYECKECGGSRICEHKRRKSECIECGGSRICEHKRIRYQCKECGGSKICEHNRQKSRCKECGGVSFCSHEKIKNRCKICSRPCPHSKKLYKCTEGCYLSLRDKMNEERRRLLEEEDADMDNWEVQLTAERINLQK